MDFSILPKAGLSQGEFADLVGVSRTTVNLWVNGKMKPNRFIKGDVEAKLSLIAAALEAGSLPLARNVARADRAGKLKEVVGGAN